MRKNYSEIYYDSDDGLRLFARDYGTPPETCLGTLLCMHGLTRNSADFDSLAQYYKSQYRVISMDQRGRGRSAYDPDPDNYSPEVYCRDMFTLIGHLKLDDIIAVGTSMGGLMAMIMVGVKPEIFKGVILNDIGPIVDPRGIERIKSYVGGQGPFKSFKEAEIASKLLGEVFFPKRSNFGWAQFVSQTCELRRDRLVHFAYDKAISKDVQSDKPTAVPPDLWGLFAGFAPTPLLTIRGANSDILSRSTVEEMAARHTGMVSVEIPDVGHVPMLNEPEAITAISRFLAEIKFASIE